MKYPERNKHCPERAHCFDYHDRACDSCAFGRELHKLHLRIARLKDQEERHLSSIKLETVKDFGKYLIDHTTKLPDGTVGISATDIVDLTVNFLEELK